MSIELQDMTSSKIEDLGVQELLVQESKLKLARLERIAGRYGVSKVRLKPETRIPKRSNTLNISKRGPTMRSSRSRYPSV